MLKEEADDQRRVDEGPEAWLQWWNEIGKRELRCILMTAWDPIGVSDTPEAWDEYDSYLPGVAYRLRDAPDTDAAAEAAAAYLGHVESDFMGIERNDRARPLYLGETLAAWHEWSFLHGGRPPHEWID